MHVRLLATPQTAVKQSLSVRFSRQEYWNGVPLPSPKSMKRDKEGYYIMIKGSIEEEDITLLNIYVPNIAPQM